MAFTLVVNPGSSSKKFTLFENGAILLDAYVERSLDHFEMCTAVNGVRNKCETLDKHGYGDSLFNFIELAKSSKGITDSSDINTVAVRVVAPGTYFQQHRLIDDVFVEKLKNLVPVAPLHIPHVLQEIEAIKKFLPGAKMVATSDSAFHSTVPDYVRRYSITEEESEDYDIYHFGYHGLSVASVMRKLPKVSKRKNKKVIVCHIGSGVSITAVKDGQSIDTTMGYAPGSGLVMGSRAGDLPSGALLTLMQLKNMKPQDALIYLQTAGGLKGLAGESDLRIILDRRSNGDKKADLAIRSFVYQIQKAIGSYVAALGGIDALVLTATASERNPELRKLIVSNLGGLNIKINTELNEQCLSRDGIISLDDSEVEVLVVKTDESSEMLLASEVVSK